MEKVELHYFEGRGLGEIIRLLLSAGNTPFTSVYYEKREQFLKAIEDGTLVFKALPILYVDGLKICQTGAIVHYLAGKFHLAGDSLAQQAEVNMYYEGSRDIFEPFKPLGFIGKVEDLIERAKSVVIPKFFPVFEKKLSESNGNFLVGDKLSLADCGFLEVLLAAHDYCPSAIKEFPKVQAYFERMMKEDWMRHYVEKVRMPPNDDRYCNTVKLVLDRKF